MFAHLNVHFLYMVFVFVVVVVVLDEYCCFYYLKLLIIFAWRKLTCVCVMCLSVSVRCNSIFSNLFLNPTPLAAFDVNTRRYGSKAERSGDQAELECTRLARYQI